MALDQNYFDAINIDVVKKKYYNANKVNAVGAGCAGHRTGHGVPRGP